MTRIAAVIALLVVATSILAAGPKKIHIVYMGGNDCPPCRAWRANELPKLQQIESFKRTRFSYVEKLIHSGVPPSLFLPSEVKPYKDKLDAASNGLVGSPQVAILVDGEIYDYYFGTRTAADMDRMLRAIYGGKPYPFKRCLKRKTQETCAVRA
jgi:hypothetical protein